MRLSHVHVCAYQRISNFIKCKGFCIFDTDQFYYYRISHVVHVLRWLLFTVKFWEFYIYSKHWPFIEHIVWKYSLTVCSLFSFSQMDLLQSKSFSFWWDRIYKIFLLWIFFLVFSKHSLPNPRSRRFFYVLF